VGAGPAGIGGWDVGGMLCPVKGDYRNVLGPRACSGGKVPPCMFNVNLFNRPGDTTYPG